jgi:cell wall-associated NlpC family hydrolase
VSSSVCIRVLVLALVLAVPVGDAATTTRRAAGEEHPRTVAPPSEQPKPHPRDRRAHSPLGDRAARLAAGEVGTPYVWGGAGPGGFDCSGLTSWVYGELGVRLPHSAAAQFDLGRPVPRSRLRRGDLLFFDGLGHVGLYLGRGRMVHAPQSGRSVEVVQLAGHYAARLIGARRVV